MFFGIDVKTNRNQASQIVLAQNLRLGQAVLNLSDNIPEDPVSLVVEYYKHPFVIAVLDSKKQWQVPLDLCFEKGASLRFYIRGAKATVHVTGYDLLVENDKEIEDVEETCSDTEKTYSDSDESETAVSEEDEQPVTKKQKTSSTTRTSNGILKNGSPHKRLKNNQKDDEDDNDEDDEDDEDDESDDDEYIMDSDSDSLSSVSIDDASDEALSSRSDEDDDDTDEALYDDYPVKCKDLDFDEPASD